MNYNVWNKWDKLQTVLLGDCYSPEFFASIKNPRIKTALQRIAAETQEDLDFFQRVLKDFGCNVLRPELDNRDSIENYTSDGKVKNIPRGPLQPRDGQVVIGNDLFYTGLDHPAIDKTLHDYDSTCKTIPSPLTEISFNGHKGDGAPDWPTYEEYIKKFCRNENLSDKAWVHDELTGLVKQETPIEFPMPAPSITVVGKDIYIDINTGTSPVLVEYYWKHFIDMFPNFRINMLNIGGHNDACFHTIKPNCLISLYQIQKYENTFPGWNVCYLPDQSWSKVDKFIELKSKNRGKWWVPGEEENDQFTYFVETWLQDWVGYVEETVFDVNVLVLDEHHVCVSQPDNEIVNAFLKKHNIEPVYIPWRHRYFWDGGLHCITLDLQREGTQQDYFPNRTNAITDKGF